MASTIQKVKLHNYKRFREFEFVPNKGINIIVGDNEAGKSTILEAIDLVVSGNVRKVENIGIDRIINASAINEFFAGGKNYKDLPVVRIELFLDGDFGFEMEGKNNSDDVAAYGLRMICEPNPDFEQEILESLRADERFFPYDYYKIRFSTFADDGYSGYKKKIKDIFIDSSNMNSDYATTDFIKRMYSHYTESNVKERVIHKSKFRQLKSQFEKEQLTGLNSRVPEGVDYSFGFKGNDTLSFSDELMIYEKSIPLDSKGTGTQIFVKVDFALSHKSENVEIILIEEPENHLSYIKLRSLIEKISEASNGQIFITTHDSMISTRLELRNVFILQGDEIKKPLSLHDLQEETAKYFMKTPPASIIEFALSNRVILVEGPAEYMLMDDFYKSVVGHKMDTDNVQVLDIRGLSFKRFLEIAQITGARVAVITDNDGDGQKNCIDKYVDFKDDNIEIFFHGSDNQRTFEIVLEDGNKALCEKLFGTNAVDYMLKNKTEAAYALMNENGVVVPDYIKRAIEWIRN
ncbi:ATP-dependent nuclease [Butyrivibrio sp. WCE2006]|uniref:ATP-dependent nuclease n=1 Tax=Butyrivibrio sp. WCE2006 TaxID=1410611 RepID=UPI0005D2C7CA|nr:TOPRIM nucleotidyl transferase/hydrolase domain-containing protein [Butyrivibrio sp. WCE2006]